MSSAHHEAGRSPVLIGVGQVLHRVDDHNDGVEPLELMARALEAAEADSGVSGLLAQADSVRVRISSSPSGCLKFGVPMTP